MNRGIEIYRGIERDSNRERERKEGEDWMVGLIIDGQRS